MGQKISRKEHCHALLDRALIFAAEHTDPQGRMVVDGEIDVKDPGWLVLGGVVRISLYGKQLGAFDLGEICRKWTLAAIRVDDPRSAWTTFSLLLSMDISGGINGSFHSLFTPDEQKELKKFFLQIDIGELLAASRNYHIAAGLIDLLRCRFGYLEKPFSNPVDDIQYMFDGYLGNGFFNDDDGRGSRDDRRIDAYSAEIIGLLLNYDSIFPNGSPFREKIHAVIKDFCAANLHLVDQHGEYAKWGRSLRGEAEIKKVFLWEYAERHGLTIQPGDGAAVADKMIGFFEKTGITEDGRIFRDKGGDRGIWDGYTTIVQAQGYGIYGLAMECLYASDQEAEHPLPSAQTSYVKYLPGPKIICANDAATGIHYILPAANRMTKNMFFWHNRRTGESNVDVDVSAKFQSLPYFGKTVPAPYDGPQLPILPMLENAKGELLIPRGLKADAYSVDPGENEIKFRRVFSYCKPADYEPVGDISADVTLICRPGKIDISAEFSGNAPEGYKPVIFVFEPTDDSLASRILCDNASFEKCRCAPSIYDSFTEAVKVVRKDFNSIQCKVEYVKK